MIAIESHFPTRYELVSTRVDGIGASVVWYTLVCPYYCSTVGAMRLFGMNLFPSLVVRFDSIRFDWIRLGIVSSTVGDGFSTNRTNKMKRREGKQIGNQHVKGTESDWRRQIHCMDEWGRIQYENASDSN